MKQEVEPVPPVVPVVTLTRTRPEAETGTVIDGPAVVRSTYVVEPVA
jgi:hypothetical protein